MGVAGAGTTKMGDSGIRDRGTRRSCCLPSFSPSCCQPTARPRQATPPQQAAAGGVQLRSNNRCAILSAAAWVGKEDKCWSARSNNAWVCCCGDSLGTWEHGESPEQHTWEELVAGKKATSSLGGLAGYGVVGYLALLAGGSIMGRSVAVGRRARERDQFRPHARVRMESLSTDLGIHGYPT